MEDKPHLKFDVVIVGAGMVGLSLACALARLDLKIAIIDRAKIVSKDTWHGYDARVSAIVKSSEFFFKKYRRMGLYSAGASLPLCRYGCMGARWYC